MDPTETETATFIIADADVADQLVEPGSLFDAATHYENPVPDGEDGDDLSEAGYRLLNDDEDDDEDDEDGLDDEDLD